MERDEISAEDLARAVDAARRARRSQPRATRFYWADRAVREVFADRLGTIDGAVPPSGMPLYYRLVTRVEAALWHEAKGQEAKGQEAKGQEAKGQEAKGQEAESPDPASPRQGEA